MSCQSLPPRLLVSLPLPPFDPRSRVSWMKRYDWCSFSWDPVAFPDPKKYLTDIKKEYNVKVCAWINPYIAQRADIFKEGCQKGFFLKRPNGSVWQW